MTWGIPLLVSYHFAFSYCSWGSQGKNTEVACHSFLQWTTFCQTSPPWRAVLGCPTGMAWFHWVRQGCGPSVIRLTSFLWVWFQCDYPLMPSCNTYHLTWVSLTLGLGYLFTAAPAKHSSCSLPWTRGISSQPPLWPSCTSCVGPYPFFYLIISIFRFNNSLVSQNESLMFVLPKYLRNI